MKKILQWLKGPKSDFILFIIFLVLLNLVGHRAFVRFDLTAPKSYSLSKASKTLVKNIVAAQESLCKQAIKMFAGFIRTRFFTLQLKKENQFCIWQTEKLKPTTDWTIGKVFSTLKYLPSRITALLLISIMSMRLQENG